MPPNRLTLAPYFTHRGPGHRPWVTDARSPAPRAPPPACPRFSPAESAPHMSHVTNSLCGGEFLRVSRGTGPQPSGRCRVPIRSAQSRSPHSRVRDGHGAYRLCCGLACGDDARAPRHRLSHRASGPRRPLPAPRVRRHEQSWPNCGMLGHVSLTSRATRTPKRRRAKTPTRTAGRLKRQNHQNSRHRAETKRSTRAKSEEASAAFRLSRVPPLHRAKP